MAIILQGRIYIYVLVSSKYNFLFVHVPKTGGTSIVRSLSRCRSNRLFRNPKHQPPYQHRSVQHLSTLFDPDVFDSLFKFAFVRNPWSYVASFYLYTKRHRRLLDRDISFADWLTMDPSVPRSTFQNKYCSHTVPITHTPQLSFLKLDGKIVMDYIGRFENLLDDFQTVVEKLSINEVRPLQQLNVAPTSYDYREMYDNRTHDHVALYFAEDINYFNYKF